MLIRLDHKVHVLFRRQDIDMVKLEGKVVVVLDVLFATSTMIAALGHGASCIIPALNEADARQVGQTLPPNSYVFSGELFADTINGFAPPTPLALVEQKVEGKIVVYATTNGTVALKESAGGNHVYAGALLNAPAVVAHIAATHPQATIVIVCSGSMGNPNLEDTYGAGYFVDLIARVLGENRDFSDAAVAARAVFRSEAAESMLLRSRVGQLMQQRGLTHEVRYAAQLGILDVVPKLLDGRLEPVGAA
jgi:2-phosphosulfolactate phosphatase